MEKYYPVYSFVVDNYGYGEKTNLWIVAKNYEQAFLLLESLNRNIDLDYCDEFMADTGYYKKLNDDSGLPYVDNEH